MSSANQCRPERFFAAAYTSFQQATRQPVMRDYVIGGYAMRLCFASTALVPIVTPAFAHLATTADGITPALTICLWDSVSTGTRMPAPPWTFERFSRHPVIRGYSNARFHTTFDGGTGVLNMLDRQQGLALYWVHDARLLPTYESGTPLVHVLHGWMRHQGRHVLHAAAVGTATGGALLVGRGGIGKSTTALACLLSQLVYVGDDYCLLAMQPVPYVHGLYNSGKMDAASVQRLPFLAPFMRYAEPGEKAIVFVYEHYPEKVVAGFPLRTVLLPHVTGRMDTVWRHASPAEGLRALAPSTLLQLPGAEQDALRMMAALVRQVPCYHLEVGQQMGQIPEVIGALIGGE
jgi:hypothetical protein